MKNHIINIKLKHYELDKNIYSSNIKKEVMTMRKIGFTFKKKGKSFISNYANLIFDIDNMDKIEKMINDAYIIMSNDLLWNTYESFYYRRKEGKSFYDRLSEDFVSFISEKMEDDTVYDDDYVFINILTKKVVRHIGDEIEIIVDIINTVYGKNTVSYADPDGEADVYIEKGVA